jgi:hypothetical protein
MNSEQNMPPSPGTRQTDRTLAALDPASAPLDGRTPGQISTDAREFADHLAYWTSRNQLATNVRWSNFFPDLESIGQQAAELEAQQHAQKGLFLSFLNLYRHAQDDLNGLTARHLNFQYRDILRLAPEPARPDKAHLVLNLKKAITEARIPSGTRFQTGDALAYESTEEIFLRKTGLAHIRTIHVDPDEKLVYAAPIANSLDGLGEDLDENDPSWHPFGSKRDLPSAECGFALSSPILLLGEGEREITVILKLSFASTPPPREKLEDYFKGQLETHLSTAEEWIVAPPPTATLSGNSGNERTLTLVYLIPPDEPAITAYDLTVLPGGYDTLAPVMKWTCTSTADHDVSTALSEASLKQVKLKVSVNSMKDLDLENDHGKIDPSKPFYPFGPVPRVGSSFYLGAEEALNKNVTSAGLTIDWKNPPPDFATRYEAYKDGSEMTNSSFTAQFQILKNGNFEDLTSEPKQLFHDSNATNQVTIDSSDSSLSFHRLATTAFQKKFSRLVKQAKIELPFSRVSIKRPVSTLQVKPALQFRSALRLPLHPVRAILRPNSLKGFLRLKLNKDFGQSEYPGLFASAVANNSDPDNATALVPKPPYIPEIAKITLSYEAGTPFVEPTASTKILFESREIRLFHLDAFGQREEHTYIKNKVEAEDKSITLLPQREIEGQLLLGFTGLTSGESISLLFQVKNGTADPNTSRRDIKWSYLSSNHWMEFKDEEILMDTTEGFLTSGIVRLLIPRSANDSNTLLEPNFIWLRARVDEKTKATCRLVSIHPNAVPVSLTNPTVATHLGSGLPAESIVSSSTSLRGVKEVTQPYPSTGGSTEEEDPAFRTRVSELLRHRGRASSAWDYEHLVLQAFPNIFKAQTLNHTDRNLNRAPGHVTLVVLPDSSSTESASSLTPQVDTATLSQINDFLNTISSDFVTAEAINPAFESIHLRFKVAFHPGHPYNSYREILRQDLQNHLAPWTTTTSTTIDFGRHLYRSALIAFIDSLPYVDFLTDLELFHLPYGETQAESVLVANASRPGAILTPTGTHEISPAS